MVVSRRNTLRAGFGVVIAILIFSTVQSYRIQGILSEQRVDIYRQYVKQDEAISQMRRSVWLAGSAARDFFLSTEPDRVVSLQRQLRELESQSEKALASLEKLKPAGTGTQGLHAGMSEYWRKLDPIPQSMLHADSVAAYRFVQEEVVPRRSALYNLLQEITEADQQAVQASETLFTGKRQEAVNELLFMLGLSIVLGFLVARFSLRHAERLEQETARQYEEVANAKREMEQLSARLLEIEEDGRRRLSRELHDEIGQTLAVLQIEISRAIAMVEDLASPIHIRLERAQELAEKTVQTVRNISLLLRPALLDDLGLAPALQWLLEDFQRRSGVAASFAEEDVEEMLPDSVKTCVYRVVQEALHNCEKHAQASQVHVALHRSANQLEVRVEDNGRGLELNAKGMPHRNAGLGILGMRERAARLGGALIVQSAPGHGTQVILRIPLAEVTVAPAAPAPTPSEVNLGMNT